MSEDKATYCTDCGKVVVDGDVHEHDYSEHIIGSRTVRVALTTFPHTNPRDPSKTFVVVDLMLGSDTCVRHALLTDVARKMATRLMQLAELAEKVDAGEITNEEAVRIIAGNVS